MIDLKMFNNFFFLSVIYMSFYVSKINNVFTISKDTQLFDLSKREVNFIESKKELNDYHNESQWLNKSLLTIVHLKDNHEQLTVHWAGEDSPVIICLAKNRPNTKQNQSSSIYISNDYGRTFFKITKFNQTPLLINAFYVSPVFNSYYIFVDQQKFILITKDFGRNFQKIHLDFTPKTFKLHHTLPNLVLAQSIETNNTGSSLYLSENFGLSWKKIQDEIGYFSWLTPNIDSNLKTILIQRLEPNGFSSLLTSTDFFLNPDSIKVWLDSVKKVEINKRFIFATRQLPLLSIDRFFLTSRGYTNYTLQFWISVDHKPFHRVIFNEISRQPINFYVADVTDDAIFICVTFTDGSTNLYMSNKEFTEFTLSLENIVFFNPLFSEHVLGLNYEIIKDQEFVDFHRIPGIRGIYIASQWKNHFWKSISSITTMITFDLGNKWHTLKPPERDSLGKPISCAQNCSLHLGQRFLSMSTNSKLILTRESSVGFILATGVIGNSLKGKQNLYLSIDAGNTWREILSGNYIYAFGDFGAIIVAVEHYSNELLYSIDDGYSFSILKFYSEKILVYGLLTEPGEKTTIFTIYGSKNQTHEWIVIQVNLTDVFDSKCHMPQDYKEWSPHDFESNCLLGSTQIFLRKISNHKCFNGNGFVRPVFQINCPCKHSDYECDFGYVPAEKTIGFNCILDERFANVLHPDMTNCDGPGKMFNKTKGYRKIIGDTCEGGDEDFYSPQLIPCPLAENEFILFVQRHEISMILLNNEIFEKYPLLSKSFFSNALAADFDIKNRCLFWSDINPNRILKYCFNGRQLEPEIIIEFGLDSADGIVFNQINGHLYIINRNKSKIEMINTQINSGNRMRRTILSKPKIKKPKSIAIDPIDCFLFIADWNFINSAIIRSDLDGENVKVLFNSHTVTSPTSITVDYHSKRIFWVDVKSNYIASSEYDGKNLKYSLRNDQIHPYILGVFKEMIFYEDRILHKLMLISKNNATVRNSLLENITNTMDLKIVNNQFQNYTNICNDNICSLLCIAKPFNSFRCLCPDGMSATKLPDGNEICYCPPNQKMINSGICKPLVTSNITCLPTEFQCDDDHCIPINLKCDNDYDCNDGSDEKNCFDNECKGFRCKTGKCIRKLWVCDYEKDCEDGSDEDLSLCNLIYPKCDDPDKFQCNNHFCINKSHVCDSFDDCHDGTDEINCPHNSTISVCLTFDNYFQCDNGNCIQKSRQCDGFPDCSDKSDENDCIKCSEDKFSCPQNVCIAKEWVCDFDKDCIDGSDELNCSYHDFDFKDNSPSNNFNTSLCPKEWIHCLGSSEIFCIPSEWFCDGNIDCPDKSDELYCLKNKIEEENEEDKLIMNNNSEDKNKNLCGENHFSCYKSKPANCIFSLFVCDGEIDCSEGEDEFNCSMKSIFNSTCPQNYFSCLLSLGCIPPRKVCDGKKDCFDGSDEWGCLNSKVPINSICLGFICKNGECIQEEHQCDHHEDCLDGSDEENCGHINDKIKIFVYHDTIRTDSFTIYWTNSDLNNFSYLYMPAYSLTHKHKVDSFNASWTTAQNYTFKNLRPNYTYKVFVYSKLNNSDIIFPPVNSIKVTTQSIKPDPPENFSANIVDYNQVLLKWSAPKFFEETIKGYKVYQIPPEPAITFYCRENHIQFPVHVGLNYTFWVTSLTKNLESDNSQKIFILAKSVVTIKNLSYSNVSESSLSLEWTMDNDSTRKWLIIYTCEDYFPSFSKNLSVKNTKATITNLSPGVNYQFKLYPYIKGHVWLEEIEDNLISVRTLGFQLPSIAFHYEVIGSMIALWWSPPTAYLDKNNIEWEYAVFMGDNIKNLQLYAQTKETKLLLKNLLSCHLYLIEVRVIKPYGIGPRNFNESRIMTEFDPTLPPKIYFQASNFNKTIYTISWDVSCPQHLINQKIGYIVSVHDLTNKYQDLFRLQPTEKTHHSFHLSVHYGATYEIKVSTTNHDSIWSEKIILKAPPMPIVPKPFAYIDKDNKINIVWKTIDSFPSDYRQHKLEYKVYIHNEKDVIKGQFFQIKEPPLIIESDIKCNICYIGVALIDNHGYSGPISEKYTLYYSALTGSPLTLLLMETKVFLLIITISTAAFLIFYIMYRSFQKLYRFHSTPFVSSHYNSRSESATLSSFDNIQEENQTYADDEPLVLA